MTQQGGDGDGARDWIDRELSRRTLIRRAGAGALSLSAASWLMACGEGGLEGAPKDASSEMRPIAKGPIGDRLNFSNWPLYIDVDEESGDRPTLERFEREFGPSVKYTEEINDNVEFYGKVRQQLARGDSGGRDLFVVTDWMVAKMKQLGWLQRLDKRELPNVDRNLLAALKSPSFDPEREFSVPWQSGMVGIAYRRDKVGRALTGVEDLFDPKFKGKVTMLSELRDTVGLLMLAGGSDPARDGVDAALAAIRRVEQANESGQIRRFTGNEFTKDLLKGDAWASIAWSGDTVQLQADNENIEFLLPAEGYMLFSDNMVVPVGAPHPYTAEVFMNYVYRPEVAADIAAYVNYVTPVRGAQPLVAQEDRALASDPLIFPNERDLARAHIFRELAPQEDAQLSREFQRVVGA